MSDESLPSVSDIVMCATLAAEYTSAQQIDAKSAAVVLRAASRLLEMAATMMDRAEPTAPLPREVVR